MRLILVRHAEDKPAPDSLKYDDPLSEPGRAQATFVAGRFTSMYPAPPKDRTYVYSSPLLRTATTAVEIVRATGAKGRIWPQLAEIGYLWGERGRSRSEFARRFPELELPDEIREDGWAAHATSEAEDDLVARGERVLERVLREHPAETDHVVFLVTHDYFIHGFLTALFKPGRAGLQFFHGHGCLSELFFKEDGTIDVQWINSTTHMWTKPGV